MKISRIRIKDNEIFEDVTIDLKDSDVICIVGENGTGKSLLAEALTFRPFRSYSGWDFDVIFNKEGKDSWYKECESFWEVNQQKEEKLKSLNEFFQENPVGKAIDSARLYKLNMMHYSKQFIKLDYEWINQLSTIDVLFTQYLQLTDLKSVEIRERVNHLLVGQTIADIDISKEDYNNAKLIEKDWQKKLKNLQSILGNVLGFESAKRALSRLEDEIQKQIIPQAIINKHTMSSYSYGERLMISLFADIFFNKYKVIFLDEIDNGLHPKIQKKFLNFLKEINIKIGVSQQYFIATYSPHIIKEVIKNKHKLLLLKPQTNGKVKIEDICYGNEYISYGKINYEVFDIPTEEYHQELYNIVNVDECSVTRFDSFLKEHGVAEHLKKTSKSNRITEITLPIYIRNTIHHPENTYRNYDENDLRKSIEELKKLL